MSAVQAVGSTVASDSWVRSGLPFSAPFSESTSSAIEAAYPNLDKINTTCDIVTAYEASSIRKAPQSLQGFRGL